jgi:hypothetical protein
MAKYKPEYAGIAKKMCELGAIDTDIQEALGIAMSTFYKWRHDFPEFKDALKIGKESCDDRVEMSLYKRAVGYTQKSVKVFNDNGKEMIVEYDEEVKPDPTSCFFWLKNRRSTEWSDKQSIDHQSSDGSMSPKGKSLDDFYSESDV